MTFVSIIILNWNSGSDLERCISSIYKYIDLEDDQFEIIVIDNGSKDNSISCLEKYNKINIIKNKYNIGVSPARVLGISIAKGEYIHILDVDTELIEPIYTKKISFLKKYRNIKLIGAKLILQNEKVQYSWGNFFNAKDKLIRILKGRNVEYINSIPIEPFYTGFVLGASQFFKRDIIKEIGSYDKSYFYGVEDIDFCLRIWKAGYKVAYFPYVSILHKYQRRTRKRSNFLNIITVQHIKSLLRYFFKNRCLFTRKNIPIESYNNLIINT